VAGLAHHLVQSPAQSDPYERADDGARDGVAPLAAGNLQRRQLRLLDPRRVPDPSFTRSQSSPVSITLAVVLASPSIR